jgi:thermolysin metallopeptidase-like protein
LAPLPRTRLPRGKKWPQLDELAAQRRARAFPISAYDEIPHHLRHGRPVLASFYVHRSNWYGGDSAKPGLLRAPEPDEPLLGSVLLTIVGFDEADGSIRFAHSWGDGWGDRGFGSMERETAEAIFAGGLMWAIEPRTEDGFRWASPAITAVAPDGTTVAAEPAAPKRRAPRRRRSGLLRKVYDAKSQLTSDFEGLTLARGEGDAATGDAAVDETYDAMGAFFNFFLEVFDRRSLDDEGAPLEAVVHYGSSFSNAWWDGQRLIVGDGDAKLFNGFYSCPEVLAAELSHGVIARETQLSYDGESGALSQSIGQVFGLLVKQHALKQDVESADWLVGAGLFLPEVNAKALFSMAAPGSAYDDPSLGKDPQPAHMSDYVKTEADNGGIHTNAGIPNHAFYLVATALGGNAWERSGRIWYEALCASGESQAIGFRQFAESTLAAARRMYGARSKELKAVRQAWTEVGVLEPSRS